VAAVERVPLAAQGEQACYSAWGPRADRRDNRLIYQTMAGRAEDAYSHAWWSTTQRSRLDDERLEKRPLLVGQKPSDHG